MWDFSITVIFLRYIVYSSIIYVVTLQFTKLTMKMKNVNRIRKQNYKLSYLIILILLFIPIYSKVGVSDASTNSDLSGVRVAIYNCMPNDDYLASKIALKNMFNWMNTTVEDITPERIQNGELIGFNILVMPGKSPSQFYYELGNTGVNQILRFVGSGGSYFGICGGAVFAAIEEVNLFSGFMIYPVPNISQSIHITNMVINKETSGPDLSNEPNNYSLLFWGSSYFEIGGMNNIIPIAIYPECNKPGMIVFKFGLGNVFLSSPHPEFEENSARDGTDIFDNYDDPDSEWNFMLKITNWLVDNSQNYIVIVSILGISISVVVLVIIFMKIITKRKSKP